MTVNECRIEPAPFAVDNVRVTTTFPTTDATTRPPIDHLPPRVQASIVMVEAVCAYAQGMRDSASRIAEYNSTPAFPSKEITS